MAVKSKKTSEQERGSVIYIPENSLMKADHNERPRHWPYKSNPK